MMGFFLDTKIGRGLAAVGAVVAFLAVAAWRLLTLGAQREQARQDKARLEAVRQRKETDDEVGKLNNDGVSRELDGWMRD